jgi:ABC-2 type transport system permease protein
MTVFKTYFKIFKRFLPTVFMYTVIFLILALMIPVSNRTADFTASKPRIAVINNDSNTKLIESFNKYLEENTEIISIENDENSLSDALFFRDVCYIIEIPENFTKEFLSDKEVKLETRQVPDSTDSMYAEMLISRFLDTARMYAKAGIEEEILAEKINIDLKEETKVTIDGGQGTSDLDKAGFYYNSTNYLLLACNIAVISTIMGAFNRRDVRKRNDSSPISVKRYNLELILGNISVSLFTWCIFVGLSFFLYKETMLSTNGLLFVINTFVFLLSVITISFLIGMLTSNRAVVSRNN